MPIKVANIRLELEEPEEGLPGKDREPAGPARERSSTGGSSGKAWTPGSHDDIHFTYAAVVDLPEQDLSTRRRGVRSRTLEPYVPERFDWPEPGLTPLEHRPVIVGAGPAGLFAGYLLAQSAIGP